MMSHITILILNWNGADLLKKCLESVMEINYSNYSVVVIDNHSSDNSIELIKNNFSKVKIICLDKNYGFAGGYNKCFDQLDKNKTENVLLLNNDTTVDSNILISLNNAINKYGSNHIYGGKIFYHNHPNKIWYAGGKIKLSLFKIYHIGIRKMDSNRYSIPLETDYITGCCLFTSLKVIHKLGGFDEQFNMYAEDVDLCLRARNEGIFCYFWPDAKLWHHVSASLGGEFSLNKICKKFSSKVKLLSKYFLLKINIIYIK